MEQAKKCLIVTTFIGFGDLLYHTPIIRMLKRKGYIVDMWVKNAEPFLNNPYIDNMYKCNTDHIPIATMFYPWGHFMVGNSLAGVSHPQSHTVDYISANLFRAMLVNKDKSLDLFWTEAQSFHARARLNAIRHRRDGKTRRAVLAMSPVIGWPSRTMPVEWYASIAARVREAGFAVVLVGRDISPRDIGADTDVLEVNEKKGLHPASLIPHDLCLYNMTSLHQLAALYDECEVVLTTETGHLPIAGCSNRCHIVYAASLINPEFRMPHRNGSQDYRSTIVPAKDDYYPTQNKLLEERISLRDAPTRTESAKVVAQACINALIKMEAERPWKQTAKLR
jgi:ADP-heptose:LPS heptosyltransferase